MGRSTSPFVCRRFLRKRFIATERGEGWWVSRTRPTLRVAGGAARVASCGCAAPTIGRGKRGLMGTFLRLTVGATRVVPYSLCDCVEEHRELAYVLAAGVG